MEVPWAEPNKTLIKKSLRRSWVSRPESTFLQDGCQTFTYFFLWVGFSFWWDTQKVICEAMVMRLQCTHLLMMQRPSTVEGGWRGWGWTLPWGSGRIIPVPRAERSGVHLCWPPNAVSGSPETINRMALWKHWLWSEADIFKSSNALSLLCVIRKNHNLSEP